MLRSLLAGLLALMAAAAPASAQNASDAAPRPLKALLVTGGCCHNYFFQSQALVEGVARHAKVEWTLVHDTRSGTRGQMPLYDVPFRRICQDLGAGLTYIEMLSSAGMPHGGRKLKEMVARHPSEPRLGVQITGPDPAIVAEGSRILMDRGV